MAKQQIKTEAKVTNVVIVPADEIEAMIRARYPHIPGDARRSQNTDCGLLTDPLLDVRMTWSVQSGDTKDVEVPPDIAPPTCGIPGCPALGCMAAPTGPKADPPPDFDAEMQHTYFPRPAERLGNNEFEDGL